MSAVILTTPKWAAARKRARPAKPGVNRVPWWVDNVEGLLLRSQILLEGARNLLASQARYKRGVKPPAAMVIDLETALASIEAAFKQLDELREPTRAHLTPMMQLIAKHTT